MSTMAFKQYEAYNITESSRNEHLRSHMFHVYIDFESYWAFPEVCVWIYTTEREEIIRDETSLYFRICLTYSISSPSFYISNISRIIFIFAFFLPFSAWDKDRNSLNITRKSQQTLNIFFTMNFDEKNTVLLTSY